MWIGGRGLKEGMGCSGGFGTFHRTKNAHLLNCIWIKVLDVVADGDEDDANYDDEADDEDLDNEDDADDYDAYDYEEKQVGSGGKRRSVQPAAAPRPGLTINAKTLVVEWKKEWRRRMKRFKRRSRKFCPK